MDYMKTIKDLPKDLCPECKCENFRINHEDIHYVVCQTEGCPKPYHYEERIVQLKLIKTDETDIVESTNITSTMDRFLKRDL